MRMVTDFPFAQKKAALASWVTSGAEFDPKGMSDATKGATSVSAVAILPVKIFFRAPNSQPIREQSPPPNAHRSQLLPRCARQVVLLRMGQQRRTHAVNKVGTLLFPAATGAAGSVDGLHTRATRGAAPPPSTSSRSGRRLQPCTVCAPHGPFASCGTGSSPEGRGSSRATTEAQWSLHVPIFSDFLYVMSWAS